MRSKIVLDKKSIQRIISRMSHEITEHNKGVEELVLIGISTGGDVLCKRLQKCIEKIEGVKLPLGFVDVTFYRDDIRRTGTGQKVVHKTAIDFSLENKNVILIDDVLYTGRTIRAAMDALMDFGRPKTIQLAVLVDRGHRELPIRADYVGKNIPTAINEKVILEMSEEGNDDSVTVTE